MKSDICCDWHTGVGRACVCGAECIAGNTQQNAQPVEQVTPEPGATEADLPYTKKLLLTKNEWAFYKKLKPICDRHNLHILAKVRLADLVDVSSQKQGKDRIKYFNMVSKKHVDFVLCKPDNLQVLALLELDDKSHQAQSRQQRDSFVDAVCQKAGYPVAHIYNFEDITAKLAELGLIPAPTAPTE